jgi:hypothetical protein
VKSGSVFHGVRPSARAGAERFAVAGSLVVATLAIAGSVAFVLGGGAAVVLAAGGVLLFAIGAASCSLINLGARRSSRAGLKALMELGRELENVGPTDDLAVMLARHGAAASGSTGSSC